MSGAALAFKYFPSTLWRPSGVNAEFDPMAEVDGCSSARDCAEARSAGVMVEWPS